MGAGGNFRKHRADGLNLLSGKEATLNLAGGGGAGLRGEAGAFPRGHRGSRIGHPG